MDRIYMCIDLKSFYASVECVERKLDPLNTNLVVADKSRTEKTICLAVSPSLKSYGIGGRCRLFELIQMVNKVNKERSKNINYKKFSGSSYIYSELNNNKFLKLDYIVAPPRMSLYMKYSSKIYETYLKYLSQDDIFAYSIDEVFCDITNYIKYYNVTPEELATLMIKDVYDTTGITATAGIGTNLFLAKVAMDVVAKHVKANSFGVRIASLDEKSYRKLIWNHKPITDIWRVGPGISEKLYKYGMYTMGDVARVSETNEDLLYKLFGVNAELLIDHAWGYEPCGIDYVKRYKPSTTSISSGQVLHCPTEYKTVRLIVKEMAEQLSLELVRKGFVTDQIVLTLMYDAQNLTNGHTKSIYDGEIVTDYLGRRVPKNSHGTITLEYKTSSTNIIVNNVTKLYDRIVNHNLLIRKINISFNRLTNVEETIDIKKYEQISLFNDNNDVKLTNKQELEERKVQKTILNIKDKYGKNSIIKAMNLLEGCTMIERNKQIGGHHE